MSWVRNIGVCKKDRVYFNIKCIRKGATMKKRLIRVMSSLMFVCLLAGCGSKSSSGNAVSEAPSKNEGTESVAEVSASGNAEITLEFGHIQNPGQHWPLPRKSLRLWWKKSPAAG